MTKLTEAQQKEVINIGNFLNDIHNNAYKKKLQKLNINYLQNEFTKSISTELKNKYNIDDPGYSIELKEEKNGLRKISYKFF